MPNESRSVGSPLWTSVLLGLQSKLSSDRARAVARYTRVLQVTPETLTLGIPLDQLQLWLRDGRTLAICALLASLTDETCELAIIPLSSRPLGIGPPLSSFMASPSNREALDLATAVVRSPGQHATPLLLHGRRGSGKTHLLRAIAYELEQQPHAGEILQLSADEFSLALVSAIRADELAAFQARLRSAAALLLDDVETLAGRDGSQEELAQTLVALKAAQTQVVVTARSPTALLHSIKRPVRDQLAAGTSLELRPAEWETRVAIVLERIARWGVEARADVASEIVSNLGEGLQRLDLLLTGLMTQPLCQKGLADAGLVRRALAQGPRHTAQVPAEAVLTLVTRHFGLRLADLRSGTRTPRITAPRQISMYLLRRYCNLSFPQIGQRLRRHHTTALHAFRKIERQRDENASLHATLSLLEKELLEKSESGG